MAYFIMQTAVSATAYFLSIYVHESASWVSMLGETPTGIAVFLLVRRYYASDFANNNRVGFAFMLLSWRQARMYVAAGLLLGCWAVLFSSIIPHHLVGSKSSDLEKFVGGGSAVFLLWLSTSILVAPFVEEMIYRGAIFSFLFSRYGRMVAVCGCALLFLLIHLPQISGHEEAIISILLLSVACALARSFGGSVLAAVFLHAAYNSVIGLFSALVFFKAF